MPKPLNSAARTPGRPRSLTLEILLDAANEIGPARVSMKELANRLGVGVATVYRYVKDRDELIRLSSARAAHRMPPKDHGQDWREIVIGYGESTFSALSVSPTLVYAYILGEIGPELEIEALDGFLQAMMGRGFSEAQALEIFNAMGTIAMGAAVATLHVASFDQGERSFEAAARQALEGHDVDEVPAARRAFDRYVARGSKGDWRALIGHLIRSIEIERECTGGG